MSLNNQSLSSSVNQSFSSQSLSSSVLTPDVQSILRRYIPTTKEEIKDRAYRLTKELKKLPGWFEAPDDAIETVAIEWHSLAAPALPDWKLQRAVITVVNRWKKYDDSPRRISQLLRQNELPLPPEAAALPTDRLRHLAGVCFHLQARDTNDVIFLGYRKAAEILGDNPGSGDDREDAGEDLQFLVGKNLLERVSLGSGLRASRYRYVGESIQRLRAEVASDSQKDAMASGLLLAS